METVWITLLPEHLNDYQVAAIVTAARTEALDSNQADPFESVMPDVVARIRAEVRGCARNSVSTEPNTIPPDLKTAAIYLIIEAMQTRLPGLVLGEDIKTLIKDARDYLRRVSRCEVPIGQPSDPETTSDVQSTVGSPKITNRERNFTRDTGEGI